MLIINDTHLGFNRKGGTTDSSRAALRTYLFDRFARIFAANATEHVAIAGDLFDDFTIDFRDWIDAYGILHSFLAGGGRLTLSAGNHDASAKGEKVSSFHVLCRVLMAQFSHNFQMVDLNQYALIDGVWMVGHHTNQTLFDATLAELTTKAQDQLILLHANYDNNFVAESDHSLNVSKPQALAFLAKNCRPVFAHEHQKREVRLREAKNLNEADSVYVLGNQWPTSISDCLNNDEKFAHQVNGLQLLPFTTWSRNDTDVGYREVDWRQISSQMDDDRGFVRVNGSATAAEAAEALGLVAKLRQRSKAFVIGNSIKIDGIANQEVMNVTDEVNRFDVLEFIRSQLDQEELALFTEMEAHTC